MAGEKNDKRNCATFTWILENVSCSWQKKGEVVYSPAFAVDFKNYDCKWRLALYLRGRWKNNDIGVFLERMGDTYGPPTLEVESELAILAVDGSPLKFEKSKVSYKKNESLGYSNFVERKDVFIVRRSVFLPDDRLTIRCKMWTDENVMISKVFLARTRIGIERRSILWIIKKFSSLEPFYKNIILIESADDKEAFLCLNLYLDRGQSCEEVIRLEFSARDQRIKFSTLKVFLLDASGEKIECFRDEILFGVVETSSQILFPTKKLMDKKDVFLPDDVLSLHIEVKFSTGVVVHEVEGITYEYTDKKRSSLETKHPVAISLDSEEKLSVCSSTLRDNLKSLFTYRILCDTELRTCTEAFPAHKSILSSRSPVFKAMFANDMKEKVKEYVDIEDLKDDTVRRMLLYMYSAVVENLQWESASELYTAADKYEILTLKNRCSSYLKANLSPINACEVLLLADLHQDDDLKSFVQDFILKYDKEIINSNEWKHLMQANLKLAADTMCLKFKE